MYKIYNDDIRYKLSAFYYRGFITKEYYIEYLKDIHYPCYIHCCYIYCITTDNEMNRYEDYV